jgi:hypothetical protein
VNIVWFMKEGGGGFISLLYERFMEEWEKDGVKK